LICHRCQRGAPVWAGATDMQVANQMDADDAKPGKAA
jgi:hypothetical protein